MTQRLIQQSLAAYGLVAVFSGMIVATSLRAVSDDPMAALAQLIAEQQIKESQEIVPAQPPVDAAQLSEAQATLQDTSELAEIIAASQENFVGAVPSAPEEIVISANEQFEPSEIKKWLAFSNHFDKHINDSASRVNRFGWQLRDKAWVPGVIVSLAIGYLLVKLVEADQVRVKNLLIGHFVISNGRAFNLNKPTQDDLNELSPKIQGFLNEHSRTLFLANAENLSDREYTSMIKVINSSKQLASNNAWNSMSGLRIDNLPSSVVGVIGSSLLGFVLARALSKYLGGKLAQEPQRYQKVLCDFVTAWPKHKNMTPTILHDTFDRLHARWLQEPDLTLLTPRDVERVFAFINAAIVAHKPA